MAATINDPDKVYRSNEYPNRKLHYRSGVLPQPYAQDFLAVVVAYPSEIHVAARMITAYRKAPDEERETLIWSRPG